MIPPVILFLTFSNQVCWDGFRRLTGNEFLIKFPISKSEMVPGDDFGRLKYTCSLYPSASCTSLAPKKYTNWIKPPLPQPIRLLSLSFFYLDSSAWTFPSIYLLGFFPSPSTQQHECGPSLSPKPAWPRSIQL